MRTSHLTTLIWGAGLVVLLAGCSRKPSAKAELEKAATAMEQAAPAAPQASAPVQAAQPVPTESKPATAPTPAPAQEMRQALAAYQGGNLQDAVTRLHRLRAAPIMTPEQRIAVNDAVAAVMGEIYGLAAKGDPRAIQAVKQYEQMQTQPH